jgi:hypothetical protein
MRGAMGAAGSAMRGARRASYVKAVVYRARACYGGGTVWALRDLKLKKLKSRQLPKTDWICCAFL